jgi:hypothetical protein
LDGVSASRAKAWGDLKRTLEEYQREQAEQDSALKLALLGGRKWDFAEDICRCLDRCFPLEQQDAFRRQQYRRLGALVRHVAATCRVAALVPDDFEKYLLAHFRRDVRATRALTARNPLAALFEYLGSVAAAVAGVVRLRLVAGIGRVRSLCSGKGEQGVPNRPSVHGESRDGKQDEQRL